MTQRNCERCGEAFAAADSPGDSGGTAHLRRFCSDNCRKRASAEKHRAACRDCGASLGEGSAWDGRTRCTPCYQAHQLALTAERGHRIEAMWADGMKLREIAAELGWSLARLSVEFDRLRRKGFDLPYRNTPRGSWEPRYDVGRAA